MGYTGPEGIYILQYSRILYPQDIMVDDGADIIRGKMRSDLGSCRDIRTRKSEVGKFFGSHFFRMAGPEYGKIIFQRHVEFLLHVIIEQDVLFGQQPFYG